MKTVRAAEAALALLADSALPEYLAGSLADPTARAEIECHIRVIYFSESSMSSRLAELDRHLLGRSEQMRDKLGGAPCSS